MRKRIIVKVVGAALAALVLEASGELLDKVGLSEEEHRVARVIAQNVVSVVTGVLLKTFVVDDLSKTDEESETVSAEQLQQ